MNMSLGFSGTSFVAAGFHLRSEAVGAGITERRILFVTLERISD